MSRPPMCNRILRYLGGVPAISTRVLLDGRHLEFADAAHVRSRLGDLEREGLITWARGRGNPGVVSITEAGRRVLS